MISVKEAKLTRNDLLGLLENMMTIRVFEEHAIENFKKGIVLGNMHIYIGQEAVAAGVIKSLTAEDMITSSHRCDGHLIAKGVDPGKMMAELMGRQNGLCNGLAGKMHMAEPALGVMGANAIVGAGIPLAAGHALHALLAKTGQVTVCFFGDGAVNNGYFHEGINLSALWKLPVVFVCENNKYAISTHVATSCASGTVVQKAESYDIPGVLVDGNDVIAVYTQAVEAVERARSGNGPTLIECDTYRFRGHHEGDEQTYRTKEELNTWLEKCPIHRLVQLLEADYGLTQQERDEIDIRVKEKIEAAVAYGLQGSPTTDAELERYLYEGEVKKV